MSYKRFEAQFCEHEWSPWGWSAMAGRVVYRCTKCLEFNRMPVKYGMARGAPAPWLDLSSVARAGELLGAPVVHDVPEAEL